MHIAAGRHASAFVGHSDAALGQEILDVSEAERRWCIEIGSRRLYLLASSSGDANRNRLGDLDHAIEHLTPKSNLALLVR
jgi:hypothetical protein